MATSAALALNPTEWFPRLLFIFSSSSLKSLPLKISLMKRFPLSSHWVRPLDALRLSGYKHVVHAQRFEHFSALHGAADNGCPLFRAYLHYRHPNAKSVLPPRGLESWRKWDMRREALRLLIHNRRASVLRSRFRKAITRAKHG